MQKGERGPKTRGEGQQKKTREQSRGKGEKKTGEKGRGEKREGRREGRGQATQKEERTEGKRTREQKQHQQEQEQEEEKDEEEAEQQQQLQPQQQQQHQHSKATATATAARAAAAAARAAAAAAARTGGPKSNPKLAHPLRGFDAPIGIRDSTKNMLASNSKSLPKQCNPLLCAPGDHPLATATARSPKSSPKLVHRLRVFYVPIGKGDSRKSMLASNSKSPPKQCSAPLSEAGNHPLAR